LPPEVIFLLISTSQRPPQMLTIPVARGRSYEEASLPLCALLGGIAGVNFHVVFASGFEIWGACISGRFFFPFFIPWAGFPPSVRLDSPPLVCSSAPRIWSSFNLFSPSFFFSNEEGSPPPLRCLSGTASKSPLSPSQAVRG